MNELFDDICEINSDGQAYSLDIILQNFKLTRLTKKKSCSFKYAVLFFFSLICEYQGTDTKVLNI